MAEKGQTTGQKIRVGVVFGGRSGEHEVSLQSAQSVMDALDKTRYDIVPIGITKQGRWVTGDVLTALVDGGDTAVPAALLPDPHSSALMQLGMEAANPASLSVVARLDVIFPVLHGPYGEDGTMQGLLELAGIPYVGAGVVGSAVGMDKAIFKHVMTANQLPVLPWVLLTDVAWRKRETAVLQQIEAALPYPVFTKPANLGSSVGISKCDDRASLVVGIAEALRYDRRVVVEQGINGRELEISVLGNEEPIASVVGEIRPRREFYDYYAKYLAEPDSEEYSELMIPAAIDEVRSNELRALAIAAYQAIDCAGLGRVDLLMDRDTGEVYVNEINTIPGFTRISMYPKLWEATGISYPELLDRLIELALVRQEQRARLETSFAVPIDE